MIESPLQLFIDLVSFDQTTYALEDKIQQIKADVEVLKQDQVALQNDLDSGAQKMHDARKKVDIAELGMKELEQKERKEKGLLDSVTNQKEYQSVTKEIEALKKQQHDYEETLLVAWNQFEATKKEYEALQNVCEEKLSHLKTSIEEKQKKAQELQTKLDERSNEREVKKREVPSDWLEKYVLMRSRVANPVVPVVNGNCTACFYNLPPQDFLELKHNKMLQCKGCYRFLYVECSEPDTAGQSTEQSGSLTQE